MVFSKLELLFLRRIVTDDIFTLERRVLKYQRYRDVQDDVFEEKEALAASELLSMRSLLVKIDDELALQTLC